jgi:hypothetical protein
MDIKLSDAYRIIAQLEMVAHKKCLDLQSISEEIKTADAEFIDDIKSFNQEVSALDSLVKNNMHKDSKAQLVHLRSYAMNINSIMNNLIDEIDTFFQNTDLYED